MLCIVLTIVVRNSVHVIVDMRMWRKGHVWRYVVMVHCMIMNVMMGILLMMMDVIVYVRLRSILLVMEVVLQIVILWQILLSLLPKQKNNNIATWLTFTYKLLHTFLY